MTTQDAYTAGGAFGAEVPEATRPHQFSCLTELRPYHLLPGLVARAVHGERVTLSVVDLSPGLVMAPHRHANEQVGMVLRGSMLFTVGGEPRRRVAGDMWVIPPGVPHEVSVGEEGCTVVEVFSPPRSDWEALPRLEPGAGAWPGGAQP